jgi:hypothetical protein
MKEIARFENSGPPFVSKCIIVVSVTSEDEISIHCTQGPGELLLYPEDAYEFARLLMESAEALMEGRSDP